MRLASVDETEMTGRLPVLQQRRVLHPMLPPARAPVPLSLARPGRSTGKVRWRLPAVTLGNDGAVRLGQLALAFKTEEPQKGEIDIMHLRFIILFSDDSCALSHGHCTHSLVVFRQVLLAYMLWFPAYYCFIASKAHTMEVIIIIVCQSPPCYKHYMVARPINKQ